MTLALLMAGLQIGSKFAAQVVEDPKLKRRLAALSAGLGAGAQLGSLAGTFASPSTGLKIADSKSIEAFNKNPEGIFGGALKEGATFGGKYTLPESLGVDPGWNAPESIFNPPGEMKPFDWRL